MGGLKKRGPRRKKRRSNKNTVPQNAVTEEKELTEDDFRRMMEDAPVYRRGKGEALHQTR